MDYPVRIVGLAGFICAALAIPTLTVAQNSDGAPTDLKIPPRKKPPIVILKLDDLSQKEGTLLPAFKRMADELATRKIKGSFGLICAVTWPGAQSLAESGPEYINWIKNLHASGMIEFWFHGWDHAGHTENGVLYCEFYNRTYEEQKARFERAQNLAQEKLGFPFRTFGAGGTKSTFPSTNADTVRVVAEDPHIRVWFFDPKGPEAKKLQADGKVIFLHRAPGVSIERAVGEPDFNWFLKGYAKNPDAEYFLLQGHPNTWDETKFAETLKIIDFLITQQAVFMTPSEYAATIRK